MLNIMVIEARLTASPPAYPDMCFDDLKSRFHAMRVCWLLPVPDGLGIRFGPPDGTGGEQGRIG